MHDLLLFARGLAIYVGLGDFRRLILTALAMSAGGILLFFLLDRVFGPHWEENVRHFLR